MNNLWKVPPVHRKRNISIQLKNIHVKNYDNSSLDSYKSLIKYKPTLFHINIHKFIILRKAFEWSIAHFYKWTVKKLKRHPQNAKTALLKFEKLLTVKILK